MSWLTDPYQLAQPPSVEEDIEPEEPPGPDYYFWDEGRDSLISPDTVSHHQGIHVDTCRFDDEGNHTQMAKHCPHFNQEDEEGKRIMTGWTVQQKR